MAIITISKGSLVKGQKVAEEIARVLDYRCVDRTDLLKTSEKFNVPEAKLLRALESGPSFYDRLTFKKDIYVAFIRNAILENLKDDNVVYHGWAGQIFLKGIAHTLKVRIEADLETRVREIAKRDNISEAKARKQLIKIDEERTLWAKNFYGIDVKDVSHYDLIINIDQLSVDDCVELVIETSKRSSFRKTVESAMKFNDALIASRVFAKLVETFPKCEVDSHNGEVLITAHSDIAHSEQFKSQIETLAIGAEGVKKLAVKIWPIIDIA